MGDAHRSIGYWVEGISSLGSPYETYVWEEPMPPIPAEIEHCTVYIYPNEQAARAGDPLGGSGFLVEFPTDEQTFYYAVTNAHIIKPWKDSGESPILRLTGIKLAPDRRLT